ncbi:MAG: M50 family metallopeptidase [Leptospirales bacterium]
MPEKKYIKLALLAVLSLILGFFWEHPYMVPFKILVVYLHEISHALGAVFSGGEVSIININLNESGFTQTFGGNFLAIAGSGYLGSILFGSLMLHSGLSGKFVRPVSWCIGVTIIIFTLVVPEKIPTLALSAGLGWGGALILTVSLFHHMNRIILFIMGGLTSLYALYDLLDFFRGDIFSTDAGLIALHYVTNPGMQTTLAYAIAILITLLSIWIQYRIIMHAVAFDQTPEPEPEAENAGFDPSMLPPELALQMAEMMAKMQPGDMKNER